jgi:hypothetical protein
MELVRSTASITVQTAAAYTVTTTNARNVQVYKVQALPLVNNSYCSVNAVNNCDGTSTLLASGIQVLLCGVLVNRQ